MHKQVDNQNRRDSERPKTTSVSCVYLLTYSTSPNFCAEKYYDLNVLRTQTSLFAIFIMFAHKMSFDDLDNLFRKIIDTEQQVHGRLARVSEGNTQLV